MLAGGTEGSQKIAEQTLTDRATKHQIRFSYTMPQGEGGEITEALPPTHRCEFVEKYGWNQLVIAAAMTHTRRMAERGVRVALSKRYEQQIKVLLV